MLLGYRKWVVLQLIRHRKRRSAPTTPFSFSVFNDIYIYIYALHSRLYGINMDACPWYTLDMGPIGGGYYIYIYPTTRAL